MQKYIWTAEYSVGVAEIDEQHQHFFGIANDILEMAGQENVPIRELLFRITNLNNYAAYHLLTEENIFTRYNYPETAKHIAAHNAYRVKMKQLISEVETQGVDTKKLVLKIAEFAGDWIMNHILVMDKKYEGFMREAGIK